MQGELEDFLPCHRMSASRELLHRGFEYIPPDEEVVDDVVDKVEAARQLFAEERRRRRYDEAVEFSSHGPDYYRDRYPFFCPCEDRRHDCDGNELTEQECEEAASLPTGKSATITDSNELEAHIAGYNAYLTRINPGRDLALHLDSIRWPPPPPTTPTTTPSATHPRKSPLPTLQLVIPAQAGIQRGRARWGKSPLSPHFSSSFPRRRESSGAGRGGA